MRRVIADFFPSHYNIVLLAIQPPTILQPQLHSFWLWFFCNIHILTLYLLVWISNYFQFNLTIPFRTIYIVSDLIVVSSSLYHYIYTRFYSFSMPLNFLFWHSLNGVAIYRHLVWNLSEKSLNLTRVTIFKAIMIIVQAKPSNTRSFFSEIRFFGPLVRFRELKNLGARANCLGHSLLLRHWCKF